MSIPRPLWSGPKFRLGQPICLALLPASPLALFKTSLLTLALLALAPASFAAARFSGSADLVVNLTQTSANERFAVTAELQAAPAVAKTTPDGRFSLIADLAAPKSAPTACGPVLDPVFKNGFEN